MLYNNSKKKDLMIFVVMVSCIVMGILYSNGIHNVFLSDFVLYGGPANFSGRPPKKRPPSQKKAGGMSVAPSGGMVKQRSVRKVIKKCWCL